MLNRSFYEKKEDGNRFKIAPRNKTHQTAPNESLNHVKTSENKRKSISSEEWTT